MLQSNTNLSSDMGGEETLTTRTLNKLTQITAI